MRYEFDEFSLDTDLFEMRCNGEPVRVEPQVIELLRLLIEHRDRMVGKEEIYDTIWRDRVVSEAALSSRIKTARQILKDDGRTQRFIRTIHKKGFRFIGEVRVTPVINEPRSDEATPPPAPNATPSTTSDAAPRRRRTDQPEPSRGPAVAVLPFANLSTDPDQEYFSDGITADLIARLSRYRWIDVIARNTSFGYKGKAADIREVGRALNVSYVVEGTVQRAANRLRISVHLIDAGNGHGRWSERYDRQLDDIFDLQDEITETIAARLEPEIGFAERYRVVQSRSPDLHAWDCFHLGIFHFFKFTGPDNLEAQRLLKQSHTLDPLLGDAYAWWAYAVILGMIYWETPPTQALLDAALDACNAALEIDRQNAIFHALRARTLLARRQYDEAIDANQMAIELNPSFAAAHCGLGDSFAYGKHYDVAKTCFRKAIALSPNDPQLWAFYSYGALAFIFDGDYDTAADWAQRAIAIPNCQYWAFAHRAVALAYLGRTEELTQTVQQLHQKMPAFSIGFARQKLFYLREPEQIQTYLEGLRRAGITAA